MRVHLTGVFMAAALGVIGGAVAGAQPARDAGPESARARAAIEAANKKFAEAAARGDAAAIASVYTADAEAFPPNSDIVRSRAPIEKLWKSVLDSGISSFDLATLEVEAHGDLAYEVGTYVMKTKSGQIADRGKYCVVWKRVKGQWMLHRDIWSTNMPAPTK